MVYEKTQKWGRLVAEIIVLRMNEYWRGEQTGLFSFFKKNYNFASTCVHSWLMCLNRPPIPKRRCQILKKIASGSTGLFSLFKQGNGTNAGLLYKKTKQMKISFLCFVFDLCPFETLHWWSNVINT